MKKVLILILIVAASVYTFAQCPATVTITGIYSTTYTGSNTWIASSGSTTIPSGADVTLDANPATNGYVLLDVGFETQANSTFLAIVQSPCSLGTNIVENTNAISVFPNPIVTNLNIQAKSKINKVDIYDANTKIIYSNSFENELVTIDFQNLPQGLYLIKVDTEDGIYTQKIIKN